MQLKICSKCGWQCPGDLPYKKCKYCGTKFTMGICGICGKWSEKLSHNACRECRTQMVRNWYNKHRETSAQDFEQWKVLIAKQPHKTLTEEDWLEACKYFKGCAYCGNPEVASRSMFIIYKDGGRYAAWNIVPACEECETEIKKVTNPFARMNRAFNNNANSYARRKGYNYETLKHITSYLKTKMEVKDVE